MVQTVFQPTRKKSAGVGSFWWKHLGGLLYDFLLICGCAIFIAVFCRVGSVCVGSFRFQWKHGLSEHIWKLKDTNTQYDLKWNIYKKTPPLQTWQQDVCSLPGREARYTNTQTFTEQAE